RTLFGEPVVHGLHLVLWALDARLGQGALPPLQNIRAGFKSPVLLGRMATLRWEGEAAEVHCDGTLAAEIMLSPGGTGAALPHPAGGPALPVPAPVAQTPETIGTSSGHLAPALSPDRLVRLFPNLADRADPGFIAALLATTRIVGMECPGLHSLFSELDLDIDGAGATPGGIDWQCSLFHPELRLTEVEVEGAGVSGTLTAFLRPEAVRQLAAADAADHLQRAGLATGCYAGRHALVVGGSRGLGEAAAKLLAAGGAHVTLTYASGMADAARVVAEIVEAGGRAETLALDATAPPPALPDSITHVAYFASPKIRQGAAAGGFDAQLFAAYTAFFVDGFARLASALPRAALLYPSTTFIDTAEPRFAEYAAAKAAGETLCAFLRASNPDRPVSAPRLPRLATDQNAAIVGPKLADPVTLLLEIL
ncbi:MAG: SDR family NAD(P)-dependent oxidoreductase, partial [Pseudomonadota bacterium]